MAQSVTIEQLKMQLDALQVEVALLKASSVKVSSDGVVNAKGFCVVNDNMRTLAELKATVTPHGTGVHLWLLNEVGDALVALAICPGFIADPYVEMPFAVLTLGNTITMEASQGGSSIRLLEVPINSSGTVVPQQRVIMELGIDGTGNPTLMFGKDGCGAG